jgi:two-component system sensor histidine kinase UhpB
MVFVNQAFCNMLGYTEADLLGKTVWEFMHAEDIEQNRRPYERLMMEGVPFKQERRFLRADGSVIWVDASVSPIMDAEGKPQSAVAVEVDITARKQAEEALQQLNLQLEDRVLSRTARLRSVNQALREEIAERKRVEEALRQSEAVARENEEKLSTLFDLLPVGISFLDPRGQIIQMNSALPNILKLPKEQLLRQEYQYRKYIRADGSPMPQTDFAGARALAEAQTVQNVETGILLENGQEIWTNVSAAPVHVADVGAVVVTTDITENKRAEQALQESHDRLRILSQRLVEVQEDERRALARELHDRVGQTLAALNINLIIINSQLSQEVAQQIGTRLSDSMKLVAETIALVRDVMTDLRPAVLDDYGLEAAIESHLAQFIPRYNIEAKLEKPDRPLPRLGPSIEMTFLRIAQEALINIARHARATQVNLVLRQEADSVWMTVQDNGMGINSWQEANRPGSHGLTIMRERAEAFGGILKVKSVPGNGTKIEVSIPYRQAGLNDPQEEKQL